APALPSGQFSKVVVLVSQTPADGTSVADVVVQLRDANGSVVSGKTVALTANSASHARITPLSGVTTTDNGTVVFKATNLTPETVIFTAMDTTDNIVLQEQPNITFSVPPAAGASISPPTLTVTADGVATANIIVTLKDALNRPTPGKLITLSQGNGAVKCVLECYDDIRRGNAIGCHRQCRG